MGIVCGVGINDRSRPCFIDGVKTKEYTHWSSMIYRCYCKKHQARQPTYSECIVSDNFKSYSYFYDWCRNQVGFGNVGFELDKDLLIKGNKLYSEDTCVFLPKKINSMIEKSKLIRGDFPIGVHFDKDRAKFVATIKINGKKIFIGRYESSNDAFLAYKIKKEAILKECAEAFKEHLDKRSYLAMLKYNVDIND